MTIIHFVDYSPEYGFFGKKVATSTVNDENVIKEIASMRNILGEHVSAVILEEVPMTR